MLVRKTVKMPVHYKATEAKIQKLDSLTARLTYGISLINSLVTKDTKLNRKTLRLIVRNAGIFSNAGLSYGFVDQCIDKVIWSWRSYKALYDDWKYSYDNAVEELMNVGDDVREKAEKRVKWLDGSSHILCHGCDAKIDADINAAYNIAYKAMEALRCKDERLKVQMTAMESGMSE